MKKSSFSVLAVVFCLTVAALQSGHISADEAKQGEYGTKLVFAKSPAEAAKEAIQEEKLVFVLHVSGFFEEPDYT